MSGRKTDLPFKAVILAGGSGERFWPLSTPEKPKQFLKVFGGESLIRQSVSRLGGLVAPGNVFVITSSALTGTTRRELPELPRDNVIGEPLRRDTGAAVALGVGAAGEGVIGFFPSDQMIGNPKRFQAAVAKAIAIARRTDAIVTLGVKPDYPATCFGYIDPRNGKFVEKPQLARAKRYVREGYLWNAGMFIARAEVFRREFSAQAPELAKLCSGEMSVAEALRRYGELPKISFDYAVMEKASAVAVVPGDFGWDDVGSYAAFDRYFPHDSRGNVREGPCTVVESEDNICIAKSARISLVGVKNLVVVTTPDSVLVVDKAHAGEIKKLFAKPS